MSKLVRHTLCLLFLWSLLATAVRAQSRYDYDIPLPAFDKDPHELIYRGETLHSYLINPYTGALYAARPDTLSTLFHDQVKAESRSIVMAYLGNLRSPWIDMDYFNRLRPQHRFLYDQTLSGFVWDESRRLFYRTKTPFSKLFYQRNGDAQRREEQFDGTIAFNLSKRLAMGADFNYTYSPGYYIGNRTKSCDYRLFAALTLDRYEAYLSGGGNFARITENGGIMADAYVNDPKRSRSGRRNLESHEIPVRQAERVWNGIDDAHVFFSHRYNFGSYRSRSASDSLTIFGEHRTEADTMRFVPIASVGHILSFTQGIHQYVNRNQATWDQYPNHYSYMHEDPSGALDSLYVLPEDSTRRWQLNNSFVLSLREGFRSWVKFGLEAYVRLENKYYYNPDSIYQEKPGFSTMDVVVGGRIARMTGRLLNFDAHLESTILGENIGSVLAQGGISTSFRLWSFPVGLRAWGNFENRRPDYFIRHFHGTFHRWDVDFGYERRLAFGGRLTLDKLGTSLSIETATLQNQLYWTSQGIVEQCADPIQILSARLLHGYKWGWLAWRLQALYQLSTRQEVMPLPTLSLYGALYTDFFYARVLRVMLGVDCRWHTRYHAPYYEPAVMQFINQTETMYGNFPHLNAFVSFQLKRARFFVEYYNIGDLFISPSERFSAAHYPINPPVIRLGISLDLNK